MLDTFKKLKYGARVLLSRSCGQPETISVAGRPTVILHGGEETARLCSFLGVQTPDNAGTLARPVEGGTTDVVRDNAGKFEAGLPTTLQRSIEALTARGLDAYGPDAPAMRAVLPCALL